MEIFSTKQLTIKEVWVAALRLYGKTLPIIWPQAFAIGIITMLTTWLNANSFCQLKISNITPADIACYSVYVVLSLIMLYFAALLLYRMHVVGSSNITLRASIIFVCKKYFTIVVSLLLVLLLCSLGLLAFILPGFFLLILFFMVQPLILFEDHKCFAALKGSCRLVWGNWWRTFAVFVPILLLNYLLGFGATMLADYLFFLLIGGLLFSVFVYPLFYACILVQFDDLKLRRQVKVQATKGNNDLS